jgi:hypothetical protein
MEPVTVFTTFNPAEAQVLRSRLDAAGIPAFVIHETSALSTDGYALGVGGIRLQVPADFAPAARELIDATAPDLADPPT